MEKISENAITRYFRIYSLATIPPSHMKETMVAAFLFQHSKRSFIVPSLLCFTLSEGNFVLSTNITFNYV